MPEIPGMRHADDPARALRTESEPEPSEVRAGASDPEPTRSRAREHGPARVADTQVRFQAPRALVAKIAKVAGPVGRWARATFTLPDLVTERRPSLRDVAMHAWYGTWAGDRPNKEGRGPGRRLGQAYAVLVALPALFILEVAAWFVERFSRLVLLTPLLVLLYVTPAGAVIRVPARLLSDVAAAIAG